MFEVTSACQTVLIVKATTQGFQFQQQQKEIQQVTGKNQTEKPPKLSLSDIASAVPIHTAAVVVMRPALTNKGKLRCCSEICSILKT